MISTLLITEFIFYEAYNPKCVSSSLKHLFVYLGEALDPERLRRRGTRRLRSLSLDLDCESDDDESEDSLFDSELESESLSESELESDDPESELEWELCAANV